ncbi:MAG: rRNA pseudouridine synthase [Deltaproteobacteria bacterium]|nr:rRNA pseudouridine synthase [Deltaproteobacteria bacterium]
MTSAGLTSRREADEWIMAGRVKVNGQVVNELGTRAVWGLDRIEVDCQGIPKPGARLYLLLNKPFGYICSLKDPQGRPLVTDLLRGIPQRIYPVGRLDFDSLGLLLFTNDGDWAYRMMHPRYQVPRTYKVTVAGEITDEAVRLLRKGVHLEDGPSGRSRATVITRNQRQSILRVTITQGKSRQVRRMLDTVGYDTVHLIRTGFGNLTLGDLKVGEYRHLETEEVVSLKRMVGMV